MALRSARLVAFAVLAAAPLGCATYRDNLMRAEKAFDQNAHERALAIVRDLEPDLEMLHPQERTRYAYIRGMTDYRIGYRIDARYWLGVAAALNEQYPGVLSPDRMTRLNTALTDMNEEVYEKGFERLANTLKRGGGEAATSGKPKKKDDDDP